MCDLRVCYLCVLAQMNKVACAVNGSAALSPGSASCEMQAGMRTSMPRNLVLLLDSKRSSNVEIMLRAIKMPLDRVLSVSAQPLRIAIKPQPWRSKLSTCRYAMDQLNCFALSHSSKRHAK